MTNVLLLLGLSTIPFFRSVNGQFLMDDPIMFEDGTPQWGYRHIANFRADRRAMVHFIDAIIWRTFGSSPVMNASGTEILTPSWPWHLANLLFHAGSTLAVWGLWSRFLSPLGALLAAAVFAVHPLQVSAVAYVSGRSGIQSFFFSALGLLHAVAGGWHWAPAVVSQYFAWKSKQDAILYLALYPIVLYFRP